MLSLSINGERKETHVIPISNIAREAYVFCIYACDNGRETECRIYCTPDQMERIVAEWNAHKKAEAKAKGDSE